MIGKQGVEAAADEMLRQRDERGEDWPASIRDFPYFERLPGFREELQDKVMAEAASILRAAGVEVDYP